MAYYTMFIMILQFGWAAVQLSHLAMIPELTSSEHEYTLLTSIRYAGTIISTLLVYGAMWCSLGIEKESKNFDESDALIFRNVALLTLGIGSLCSLLFHVIIKFEPLTLQLPWLTNDNDVTEYNSNSTPYQEIEEDHNETSSLLSQRERYLMNYPPPMSKLDWLRQPQLYHIACLYLFSRLFVNISQAYMPLFLNVTLEMPATYVAIIPIIMYVSGIFMAVVSKSAGKCFGTKVACVISCIFGVAGCLWMYKGSGKDETFKGVEIYVVAIFIGAGGAGMLINSLSITAELIGKNKTSSAFVYSSISLVDKIINGVAVMIIQHYVPVTYGDKDEEKLKEFYGNVMVWVCGSFALIGMLSALSMIPIKIGPRRKTTISKING